MTLKKCTQNVTLNQLINANLMTAIQMERVAWSLEQRPFYEGEGEGVHLISRTWLTDNPIFVLRVGEVHRFGITLVQDNNAPAPIKTISDVKAALPGQEAVELEFHQKADSVKCETAALLDPLAMNCEKLLRPSPGFGAQCENCVALDLMIRFSATANDISDQPLELEHRLYLCIVESNQKPQSREFVREITELRKTKPSWADNSDNAAVFFSQLL